MIGGLWNRVFFWRRARAHVAAPSNELDQLQRGILQLAIDLRDGYRTPPNSACSGVSESIDRIGILVGQRPSAETEKEVAPDFPVLLEALRQALRTLLVQHASFVSAASAGEMKLLLDKLAIEVPNMIAHLDSSLQSRLNSLDNSTFELSNAIGHLGSSLHTRLNSVVNECIPHTERAIHESTAVVMRHLALRADRARWTEDPTENYSPAQSESFDGCLAQAREAFPSVYSAWRERLAAVSDATNRTKIGNQANGSDLYSRLFRYFVESHIGGRVLDVGCGTSGRPFYLQSYRGELISGIDPLPMKEPPDFEAVRGISEFLPWRDASFTTLISATALDHCLSLDRSLSEIIRVLRPGGQLLLWVGSVPGATKYEPESPAFQPADKFHLFHFDSAWLDPLLVENFDIVDRLEFRGPGYSHVFYCLRLPPRSVGRNLATGAGKADVGP